MSKSDKVRKAVQTIRAYFTISEHKMADAVKSILIILIVAAMIYGFFTYIPSLAQSYLQLLPERISEQNAYALLNALIQVEGTLLGFFGLIFVAILAIVQSHVELSRRELDRSPQLPPESPERRRLSGLQSTRTIIILLMTGSVLFLVISVFLTLATLAWVGTELPRYNLGGILTALMFGISIVFLAIWVALRVRD